MTQHNVENMPMLDDIWYDFGQLGAAIRCNLDVETKNEVVGMAALDSESSAENVYCLFLMISPGRGFEWRDYKKIRDIQILDEVRSLA